MNVSIEFNENVGEITEPVYRPVYLLPASKDISTGSAYGSHAEASQEKHECGFKMIGVLRIDG